MCHFSLVTTPAESLSTPQRIPHVDSLGKDGLATIHYLFKKDLGGTAFYRHRSTGFEFIDESRQESVPAGAGARDERARRPGAEYINGDTALFEQIARQDGVYNRMLVYRRNFLHSGCIGADFVPDPDPLIGTPVHQQLHRHRALRLTCPFPRAAAGLRQPGADRGWHRLQLIGARDDVRTERLRVRWIQHGVEGRHALLGERRRRARSHRSLPARAAAACA